MDKYEDNRFVAPMDEIILLNDNYLEQGLKTGYIGVVVDNFIENYGIVLADFFDPFTGEDLAVQAEIKKKDFRVFSGSMEDRKIGKAFKDLFRK